LVQVHSIEGTRLLLVEGQSGGSNFLLRLHAPVLASKNRSNKMHFPQFLSSQLTTAPLLVNDTSVFYQVLRIHVFSLTCGIILARRGSK
jgi:hypothetical protein